MKKQLITLLLLLSATLSFGQYKQKIRDEYYGTGVPNFNPATYPSVAIDEINYKVYTRNSSLSPWILNSGFISKSILPEQNNPVPVQAFPGMVVLHPVDGDDTQNIRAAVALAEVMNAKLMAYGTYQITGDILIPKTFYNFCLEGSGTFDSRGTSSPITIFKQEVPLSNDEALNVHINSMWKIEGVRFWGNQNQNGIEGVTGYGSSLENLVFLGFNKGLNVKFLLSGDIENCYFVNCINSLEVGRGTWPGVQNGNSQSNVTTVTKIRIYAPANGQTGIKIIESSGIWVSHVIVEGFKLINGIDFDGLNSTVVKDFRVYNMHYECTQGSTNAAIKVRIAGGIILIDGVFGQYPSLLLDASSQSGHCYIEIAHTTWWVGAGELGGASGKGKCFRTSNIATLHFEVNPPFNNPNASQWDGPMPTYAGGKGATMASYNTYTLTRISPHQ